MNEQAQVRMAYPEDFVRELGQMTIAFAQLELDLGLFLESCPAHADCRRSGRNNFSAKAETLKENHPDLSAAAVVQELNDVNKLRCDLIHGVAVRFSETDERFTFLNKARKGDSFGTFGASDIQDIRIRAQMLVFGLLALAFDRAKTN
jgi:hypothetical protein